MRCVKSNLKESLTDVTLRFISHPRYTKILPDTSCTI